MADYPAQSPFQVEPALAGRLAAAKEAVWFRIGVLQSAMNDRERALDAFERVLAVNPANVRAMTQAGAVLAKKECYPQAVNYLQRAISADSSCGEAWAVLAHCYVMTDDLQKAYEAYQRALSHLPNPRDPNLWYGIGLLYDRYGSLDNALEAFLAVLSISPDFERADEVCFCIGIIYKEQQNFDEALKYFNKVVVAANPPPPLTRADGWYQIGHVNELKRDIPVALEMYKHALAENPKHPKTLQNFGWLEHQHNNNSSEAIRLLKLSAELDPSDGQTWYLLGRVYMALREFRQAYDAYQQAVYRDGRNATFWCSIGVLYYQMNQFRDAMDAYSRAIRLNPYVSEVWYDLGTLYESCGQNADAIDAYRRAAELAPENTQITARLGVLENSMNPATHQQQQPTQPQQSAPQAQPQQMPPQQMQPDMHHPSQSHMQSQLNPVLNRPMAPPLQQLPQPLAQQKLPHHQSSLPPSQLPPTQQGPPHPTSVAQPGSTQNSVALSGPQRSGQMEISPISSLRPHNLSQSQPMGHSGAFSQDGRPSLPAPLTSVQHSTSHNSTGVNHLSPMMSQPMHSQPQSSVLPPPPMSSSQQESMHPFRQRSGPLPHSQLQPLAHHQVSQEQPSQRHHPQMSHPEGQQTPHQQPQLAQLSPSQQQPVHPTQSSHPDIPHVQQSQAQNHHSSPHVQPHEPQPHQQRQQQSQHPPNQQHEQQQHGSQQQQQQQSPHSQGQQAHPSAPHANSNGLPQIQPLPQLQALPQMQPQQPEHQKRQEAQQHSISGPAEPQRHGATNEQENDRTPYMQPPGESLRRQEYDRVDGRYELRHLKIPKSEGHEASMGFPAGHDAAASSQPMYSSNQGALHSVSSSGNQIASLRDPGAEDGSSAPLPPRSMAMHEITQSEPRAPPRRMEDMNRDEREQGDRSRNDAHAQNVHQNTEKAQVADRLPAMSSLSGQIPVNNSARESREDARLLTSVATPSLAIPSSSAVPSISGSEVQKASPTPVSATGGPVSAAIGTSAPPLPPMAPRNTTPLSGMSQDAKDMSTSMGPSGVGVSSLTKFGKGLVRTPATPVNSSVAPSSLPSPLPARKGPGGGGIVHAARSPRLSKPTSAPSFKSVPIPPASSSQVGQLESVPSPSSLPVLPALSSHPSNSENDKPAKDTVGERDNNREDGDGDSRAVGPQADDKSVKEGPGRKADDGMMNKPLFGILRSAPAPVQVVDVDRSDKDEKVKSPGHSSAAKQDSENGSALKREGSSRDEPGRTAKRPRLHDLNDSEDPKALGYAPEEKQKKGGIKRDAERKDDDGLKGAGKSDIPSYKESKAVLPVPSSAQAAESEKSGKRDNVSRAGEGEGGKSMPISGQVIDLPRLSTPMSRSGPPSLPGNTPLPSFRSERMKSTTQDNTSRSSLPFALRSAPVTSLPAPLKSHVPSSSRGGVDRPDYPTSQAVDEPGVKRVTEDKPESSAMGGSGSRDEVIPERVANGDAQKGSNGAGEHESRGASDVNSKDEKQPGRPEIHSSAT